MNPSANFYRKDVAQSLHTLGQLPLCVQCGCTLHIGSGLAACLKLDLLDGRLSGATFRVAITHDVIELILLAPFRLRRQTKQYRNDEKKLFIHSIP